MSQDLQCIRLDGVSASPCVLWRQSQVAFASPSLYDRIAFTHSDQLKPDFVEAYQRKTLRISHDAEEYAISPARFVSTKPRFGGDFARFHKKGESISLLYRLCGGGTSLDRTLLPAIPC
jgi:hypothetical protein